MRRVRELVPEKTKHIPITEYPCMETQDEMDAWTIRANLANLRKPFMPCVDCDISYQREMTCKNLCRRPHLSFTFNRVGEMIVKRVGDRVSLQTD